jgi:hypothetical protein
MEFKPGACSPVVGYFHQPGNAVHFRRHCLGVIVVIVELRQAKRVKLNSVVNVVVGAVGALRLSVLMNG